MIITTNLPIVSSREHCLDEGNLCRNGVEDPPEPIRSDEMKKIIKYSSSLDRGSMLQAHPDRLSHCTIGAFRYEQIHPNRHTFMLLLAAARLTDPLLMLRRKLDK